MKPERCLGPWTLRERLGSGGNGEVWLAERRGDGVIAALKILKSRNQQSEPFARFRAEVELNRQLNGTHGVLPLIDAHVPGVASPQDQAWMAMPIAQPIRSALGAQPAIGAVVEAIADLGAVLAQLKPEGIAHRDIKPDNLFRLGEMWAIGDFGIASYPGKAALTEPGRSLGPRFFIPDEMIQHPLEADAHAADVFSLAKTLWVLATESRYPPQGHQRRDTAMGLLRTYFPETRAYLLDRLIEQATSPKPGDRPSMEMFVAELRAWLTPLSRPIPTESLEEIGAKLSVLLEPCDEQARRERQQLQAADGLFRHLASSLVGIRKRLESLPSVRIDYAELPESFGDLNPPKGRKVGSLCVETSTSSKTDTILYSGFSLHMDGHQIHLRAKHHIIAVQCSHNTPWTQQWSFLLGSALGEQCCSEMPRQLNQHLMTALEFWVDQIEWYEEHRWWEPQEARPQEQAETTAA